jgi:hypothetical protein
LLNPQALCEFCCRCTAELLLLGRRRRNLTLHMYKLTLTWPSTGVLRCAASPSNATRPLTCAPVGQQLNTCSAAGVLAAHPRLSEWHMSGMLMATYHHQQTLHGPRSLAFTHPYAAVLCVTAEVGVLTKQLWRGGLHLWHRFRGDTTSVQAVVCIHQGNCVRGGLACHLLPQHAWCSRMDRSHSSASYRFNPRGRDPVASVHVFHQGKAPCFLQGAHISRVTAICVLEPQSLSESLLFPRKLHLSPVIG